MRRRTPSPRPPSATAPSEPDKLARVKPVRIEYDEMRSAEERTTYHQPRLQALGEFFLDVHPLRRIRSVRRPSKHKAPAAR